MSKTPGVWSEIELAGHPCRVFDPPAPNSHGYVVLYLHGVHQGDLRDHAPFIEQFANYGLPLIAPVTKRSWWTDRICPAFDLDITAERHVLDRVVPEIERRWGSKPPRIALLGTSMGGQGALRFAFKHPDVFPVVAAISPAIDYHLRIDEGDENLAAMYDDAEAARQDTAILHVHPLNWPRNIWFCCDPADRWYDSVERLHMKLASLGIPHEMDLDTNAGGHGFGYYNHLASAAVAFLFERLERERLRVV